MATTFTSTSPGTYDAATDTYTTPVTTTVAGNAIQVRGNPEVYRELGLVEHESPTLLWVPETYGELPGLGNTTTWAGRSYTVKAINPTAPDGVAIMARIVVAE